MIDSRSISGDKMNERIRELLSEAGFHFEVLPKDSRYVDLVELIVNECASICYNSGLQDSDAHAQNLLYEFNIDNCRNDK